MAIPLKAALLAAALGLALTTTPAPLAAADEANRFDAMTEEERASFREEVRKFLLDEPEIVLDVLRTLEDRQREQEERAAQEALTSLEEEIYRDDFSFVGGNPDGDITLVEFLDYRCGFCKRAHSHVTEFLERDGQVKLIVKEFPVLGPDSEFAGRAAMAALAQEDGRLYKPFHDVMIEHRGPLDENVILEMAADVGLDVVKLVEDMATPDIQANIESTYRIAGELGINGTPAFIMGDRIIRGFVPGHALAEIAAEVRATR